MIRIRALLLPAICGALLGLPSGSAVAQTVVEPRVAASSDDAEEGPSGSVMLGSSDLELVVEGTSTQTVGIRFVGVNVPRGVSVVNAYVQFQTDETSTLTTTLNVSGQAADNAPTFTTASLNISSRPRTVAAVAWSPPAWTIVGEAGPAQRTPNLAVVIQEIVSRPGWASGNAMAIIVTGSGRRTAKAFQGVPAAAPLLHVEYVLASANNPPQVTISAPASGLAFGAGDPVGFAGSAPDFEDGDLTPVLAWVSSKDGPIGTGGDFTRWDLSRGPHTITASVTDSGGLTGSAQTTITIGGIPQVTITSPFEGARYDPGESITLIGSATDLEDGDSSAALVWSSSLDGPIGSGSSFTTSSLSPGVHRIRAAATDGDGSTGFDEVIVAVMLDLPVVVGAGDIADGRTANFDEATAALLDSIPGTVITLGDNAYPSGRDQDFRDNYDPTWGRHKARTRPASGNHDYEVPGAVGYFNYFGAAAGDPDKGYYSYDVAGWHVIVLNSECVQVGGCDPGSPQGRWLLNDLAAHPSVCTLAYWHKPRFSSGEHGATTTVQGFWQLLYDAGADVVLNGHDHDYERFALQSPTAAAAPGRGIRQFVVGTGGAGLYAFRSVQPNSEVRDNTTSGVLKLTLHPTSYDWEFVPVAGQSFTDIGSASCVDLSSVNLPPAVSAGPDQAIVLPGGASLDGTVSDDGRPSPPALTTLWSTVSGPGTVSFGDATAVDTTAQFSTAGTYVLRLTASDGDLTSSDDVTVVASVPTDVFEVRVASSGDDVEESSSGKVGFTSSDLELVVDGTVVQTVGLRFGGVGIPRGASITKAYVQFQVRETGSGATSLALQGEASGNALPFANVSGNVSSRPRTAASVAWSPPSWTTVGAAGAAQRTPDLAPVIQEIVNGTAWTGGNALVLVVTGSGRRTAVSRDFLAAAAPLLHVEFVLP